MRFRSNNQVDVMASGYAWTLDHWHMPHVLEYDDSVIGNCSGHDFGATDINQPVMPTPDDQCRHRYVAQSIRHAIVERFLDDGPENPVEKIMMPQKNFQHWPHHEIGYWDALVHNEFQKTVEIIH